MKQEHEEERMQIKCNYEDELVHIQCVSGKLQAGRKYGFTVKMRTEPTVSMWLREQPPVLDSAASGTKMYTPFKIYRYANNVHQMYIPGTPANHPSGAVLDLHPSSENVMQLLDYATKVGFVENAEGDPFVSAKEEEE
jgi:hypothetical protein